MVTARGNAETEASLVLGARAVATLLESAFAGGGDVARRLARRRVPTALVDALRTQADAYARLTEPVARSPRRVDQRGLDLQDGRVLALMASVLTAWRGVVGAGSPVPLPDVGDLGWIFGMTVSRAPTEEAPPKPEVAPVPASEPVPA